MASLVSSVVLLAVILPVVAPLARAAQEGQELGLPHVSAAPALPSHVNVTINTSDVPAFVPNAIHATSGQNLTITLHNNGTYNHTFTLSSSGSERSSLQPRRRSAPWSWTRRYWTGGRR